MTAPSDDLEARLAERARMRWDASTHALLADAAGVDEALVDGALARLDVAAEVIPMRPRPALRWFGLGTAALAAAALLVWVMRPPMPSLPRYDASFEGGIVGERGDVLAKGEVVLLPGSRIRWSFAPQTATDVPVALRIAAGEHCIEPGGVRTSASGAIEIDGDAGDVLALPPGRHELVALLAPAARWRELDDACASPRPAGVLELGRQAIELR